MTIGIIDNTDIIDNTGTASGRYRYRYIYLDTGCIEIDLELGIVRYRYWHPIIYTDSIDRYRYLDFSLVLLMYRYYTIIT